MFVDLHFRFNPSQDAIAEFSSVIEAARERGLDGLCVCLPPTAEGAEELVKLGEKLGFKIFIGREFRTAKGSIIGVMPEIAPPANAENVSEEPQSVIDFIRETNGSVVVSQPYAKQGEEPVFQDALLDLSGINCIEVINGGVTSASAEMAMDVAQNLQAKLVAGGENIEKSYQAGIMMINEPSNQAEFVKELSGNDYWVFVIGRDPIKNSEAYEGRPHNREQSRRGGQMARGGRDGGRGRHSFGGDRRGGGGRGGRGGPPRRGGQRNR